MLKADARTLTTGVDNLTGTEGDDTFLAAEVDVFNNFDSIDGGAGRDTLRIDASSANAINGDISNIEVLSVEGDTSATYDVSTLDGLEQINFVGTTSAPSVTGLTANQTVSFTDSEDANATGGLVFTNLTVASGSTVNVALQDSMVNFNITAASNAVDTLNATTKGTSTLSLTGGTAPALAANLATFAVAASGELTLAGGSIGSDVDGEVTFNASESTGNITVTDAVLDNVTNVMGGAGNDDFGALNAATSVEAGAGDDTIDLSNNSAESITVNAGAGDDRILVGGLATVSGSIDGGEGNDTVVLSDSSFSTQGYDQFSVLQNVESLEFTAADATVDAAQLSGYSQFTFTASAANVTVSNLSAQQSVIVEGDNAGTAQTLNLTENVASTVNVASQYDATVDANTASTVTLTVADADSAVTADTLNLSGNGNFSFDNSAGETFASVDASAMTGELTYTNVMAVEESITLGADNGVDTLNVAGGSTYGSMDVITNFDSTIDGDADITADMLTGITGAYASVDASEATSLNDAFATAAADGAASTGVFFQFEDNTYAFSDTSGNSQYDDADFAIQIVGTHDLSANNDAYTAPAV
ncbi:beta strand repeat-containing protein [Modicisalibacter zincidurans]|uniref:beta strand repeat-containing protein n=1 Tax=Modicisalibacter zincidurans TaxID=1178777 RepID=UPI0004DB877B|nr:hypothetical protein [Halomonas zincidurans]